jgi:hypothetical protein
MRFVYSNIIDGLASSALTATSYLSGFPKTHVQDDRLETKWKTSTATTQSMIIDYGTSASAVLTAAVMGHNIATTATVTIQANASDSWGSPSLSTAMTVLDDNRNIVTFFASAQNYRYWRFLFTGQASLEIGRLWLSTYLQVDPSSTNEFTVLYRRSDNVDHGRGRQKYATAGIGWKSINLSFPKTRNTALNNIISFYDTVGRHSSFIFCNFDDIRTYPIVDPLYCSITGDIGFNHTRGMAFQYAITIEEDK